MQIETNESHDLISAEKVDGTNVYGADDSHMGHVKSVMIGKRDGKVRHAVLSIGGFLGMGDRYHSVPWEKLDYDTKLGGYKLNVTEDELKGAPTFDESEVGTAFDRPYEERVYGYYGVPLYW